MATIVARPADVCGDDEVIGANVRQGADRRSRLTTTASFRSRKSGDEAYQQPLGARDDRAKSSDAEGGRRFCPIGLGFLTLGACAECPKAVRSASKKSKLTEGKFTLL